MAKWGLLLIGFVMLSLFSASSFALESTDLKITNVRLLEELNRGDSSVMIFSLTDKVDEKIKDLEIKVYLLETYDIIGRTDEVDVKRGDTENKRITLDIPSYVRPGYHLFKITFRNDDDFRRAKFVEFYIN